MEKDKDGNLILKVSFTDIDLFHDVLEVLKDIIKDERVDKDIRLDYADRVVALAEQVSR